MQCSKLHFPLLWVTGEVSNFSAPTSGHLYFTLKDQDAQVRCAMFRRYSASMRCQPYNGMQVRVHASVGLYPARGTYQLLVEQVEEAGDGALQRAFEALKKKLHQEGLFAQEHKHPRPKRPQCIGIITSPTGAALQDILSILRRRCPSIPLIIYPSQVQGIAAPSQLIQALQQANQRQECDVLIIARGGGSLEDLQAFNDEALARAIFMSKIPIISAIGHEIDVTIADFVADHRAATPSTAAELASPDSSTWQQQLHHLKHRFRCAMGNQLQRSCLRLNMLAKRLKHPRHILQDQAQCLDNLEQRLHRICHQHLNAYQQQLAAAERTLQAISPQRTLERGYAIITAQRTRQVITQATATQPGDKIIARLKQGSLACTINRYHPNT